jgi:hypothetical protein
MNPGFIVLAKVRLIKKYGCKSSMVLTQKTGIIVRAMILKKDV